MTKEEDYEKHWKEQVDRMEAEDFRRDRSGYVLVAIAVLIAFLMFLGWAAVAAAHDAPSGWSYPFSCCSNQDCRQVNNTPEEISHGDSAEKVTDVQGGYRVEASQEFIPWNDARVKPSPDGRTHLCTLVGGKGTRVLCLFVPDKGY